ncbi:MAG: hypothetical protein ACI9F9_002404, partial [Candidatus Paceibacteria bacterium]
MPVRIRQAELSGHSHAQIDEHEAAPRTGKS